MAKVRTILRSDRLVSGYGARAVLRHVSFEIAPTEIVALIGHNGAGKSTLLKTVFGIVPLSQGALYVDEEQLGILAPRKMTSLGIGYVPQGNRVFADLSVYENLQMGAPSAGRIALDDRIEVILDIFEGLKPLVKRNAHSLSGGEKQLLALATGLMSSPRILLLDEPTLGLASQATARTLHRIKALRDSLGTSIMLVEQKVRAALEISDRVYVMREGRISFSGAAVDLNNEESLRKHYL